MREQRVSMWRRITRCAWLAAVVVLAAWSVAGWLSPFTIMHTRVDESILSPAGPQGEARLDVHDVELWCYRGWFFVIPKWERYEGPSFQDLDHVGYPNLRGLKRTKRSDFLPGWSSWWILEAGWIPEDQNIRVFPGCVYSKNSNNQSSMYTLVGIAVWPFALASMLVESVLFTRRWRSRRRARSGCCPSCGYDRIGLAPGVPCPECGQGG